MNMRKGSISPIITWIGIFAFVAIVLGGLTHAGSTDPSAKHQAAYGAVRGIVIPPFRG